MVTLRPFRDISRAMSSEDMDKWQFSSILQKMSKSQSLHEPHTPNLNRAFGWVFLVPWNPLIQSPPQTIEEFKSQCFRWTVSFLKLRKHVWRSWCWGCPLDSTRAPPSALRLKRNFSKQQIWNRISSHKL